MSSLLLITPINNKRGKYKEYLYDSNIKKPRSTQTLINAKKRKLENEFSKQKESSISQVVDNSNDQNVQLNDQQPHSNDKQHQSNDQLSYSINDQTNSIEFELKNYIFLNQLDQMGYDCHINNSVHNFIDLKIILLLII